MDIGVSITDSFWQELVSELKQNVSSSDFDAWISQLSFGKFDGDVLIIYTASNFIASYVTRRMSNVIKDALKAVAPELIGFEVVTKANNVVNSGGDNSKENNVSSESLSVNANDEVSSDIAHNNKSVSYAVNDYSKLDANCTFENFVVGKPNQMAFAAAEQVANSLTTQYNPLFIHGDSGIGKTHLLHAIGWRRKQMFPNSNVAYMTSKQFLESFVEAIKSGERGFLQKFLEYDIFILDDIQFFTAKKSTQEEFFHLFEKLMSQGKTIILAADVQPVELEVEQRLKSRCSQGLVVSIHETTYELRLAILEKKAEKIKEKGIIIDSNVIDYLAHKMSSSVRELEGAFNRVVIHSEINDKTLSVDEVHECLESILKFHNRRIKVDDVIKRVAQHFDLRSGDIVGSSRTKDIVIPRQIAMYLSRDLTKDSYMEIAVKFKKKDHSTVMHAIDKIKQIMENDSDFAETIKMLKKTMQSS